MEGVLLPDHIALNNYELIVTGMPKFTFTAISGIDEELETVDLPDRTPASGGHRKPVEFTAKQPMHHVPEVKALELWYKSAQEPVLPIYQKTGMMVMYSISALGLKMYMLTHLFPCGMKLPDTSMDNEGELAEIEWKFKARVEPI